MIDVHAHLCFPDFDRDREEVVKKCREELAGVVVSSARYDEGVKVLETCLRNPGFLFPTIGYHPVEGTNPEGVIRLIRENKDRISGIGECGMDYHWEKDPVKRKKQAENFSRFIELAKELKKPLVIHSWDAERECYEMLRDSGLKCVFHCFSGKKSLAEEIIGNNDFFISISTMVIFSKNIRKIAKMVPDDQFLLETDSPFLSPNKEQDKRNYPWNIKLSAEKMADLRNTETSHVLERAGKNAERVFALKADIA